MISGTGELDEDSIRYSTLGNGGRYIVEEDTLREIALALRSPSQVRGEQIARDLLHQMQQSQREKGEPSSHADPR